MVNAQSVDYIIKYSHFQLSKTIYYLHGDITQYWWRCFGCNENDDNMTNFTDQFEMKNRVSMMMQISLITIKDIFGLRLLHSFRAAIQNDDNNL